jgi:hypothetical protein
VEPRSRHEAGVTPAESEYVVNHARRPYPRRQGQDKYQVRDRTGAGEYVQVIYVLDRDRTVYVIHARPLTERERRQLRRKQS